MIHAICHILKLQTKTKCSLGTEIHTIGWLSECLALAICKADKSSKGELKL